MLVGKALNGNVMCTVGVRSVGSQIFNICVLPLDYNFKPIVGWMFDKFVQIDGKVPEVDRVFARKHSEVWDQFDIWFEEIIKKGQIIPIGYDWPNTSVLLKNFFSESGYGLYFHEDVRDIKAVANYLNDQYESEDLPIPFAKRKLRYILNVCNCSVDNKYTAAHLAFKMADAYRILVRNAF